MGGKNSMIIFDDCDLGKAVELAKRAAFSNQGEICLCCSRIMVQDGIYDKFVEEFAKSVQQIKIGNPQDKSTNMVRVFYL